MKIPTQVGLVAAVLLMTSVGAYAQRGATRFVPSRPAVPRPAPPRRMAPAPVMRQSSGSSGIQTNGTATTATFTNGSSTFTFLNGSALSVGELLNPVPGLGFDFAHLAAINRDLDIRALIDPITQQRLALAERLLRESPSPVFFPAFFPESAPIVMEQPPQQPQQPPIIIVQQPTAPSAAPVTAIEQPVTQARAEVPLPDAGEFILVKRDGTQISAVAFTRQGEQIAYITRDGKRRFLPASDLDVDSTKMVNEDRGTSLMFPL